MTVVLVHYLAFSGVPFNISINCMLPFGALDCRMKHPTIFLHDSCVFSSDAIPIKEPEVG